MDDSRFVADDKLCVIGEGDAETGHMDEDGVAVREEVDNHSPGFGKGHGCLELEIFNRGFRNGRKAFRTGRDGDGATSHTQIIGRECCDRRTIGGDRTRDRHAHAVLIDGFYGQHGGPPCRISSAFRKKLKVYVGFHLLLVVLKEGVSERIFDTKLIIGALVIDFERLQIFNKGIFEGISDFDILIVHEIRVTVEHPVGIGTEGGPSTVEVFREGHITAKAPVGAALDLDTFPHFPGLLGTA